ncbi:MAG: hypothetical protein R3Y18_02995 [Bacillota bacterium]
MIFVTGKYGSGKKKFVRENLGVNEKFDGVFFLTEYIEKEFAVRNAESMKEAVIEKATSGEYNIVICEERGCRVMPIFESHRRLVELNGEIACEMAQMADEVYLIENGVKDRIK